MPQPSRHWIMESFAPARSESRHSCRLPAVFAPVAALAISLTGFAAAGCGSADEFAGLDADELQFIVTMMAEEDSRPDPDSLLTLREGLVADEAIVRRFAVRGIGRLERPELVATLAPLLDDIDPRVRAAAARAIAQSVYNDDSGEAADLLRGRLTEEEDRGTVGSVAQALGRLRPESPAALSDAEKDLVELSRRTMPAGWLIRVARGLESLARLNARDAALADDTVARLVELSTYGRSGAEGFVEPTDDPAADSALAFEQARIRRLALAALGAAGRADADTVEMALYDSDTEVRRLATIAAAGVDDAARQQMLLQIALDDESGQVRLEGLRGYARRLRVSLGCGPILAALDDGDPHIELQAIDLLAAGCRGPAGDRSPDAQEADESPASTLRAIAESLPAPGDAAPWQHAAHALVALASVNPDAAAALLPTFSQHPTWQVRMYAARAAAAVGALDTLEDLSDDAHANVAEASIRGLRTNAGRRVDSSAIRALQRDDYRLLMTAASVLEDSDDAEALPALLGALDRITEQQRETSRDPRRAMLERIGELGDVANAEMIRPYLGDFDPQIAQQAAEILLAWTGTAEPPMPRPLDPLPFPSFDALRELQDSQAFLHMEDGGVIEIDLLPFEAPTNTARFARQARSGYFEGLTFHRVVANFVIQGGSPGANEYMGAGPYTRDEILDRAHLRGTVGISTRGRDTDDSQIFINLVDNVRLDHNYTIIGVVVSGMDIVDRLLEGATIERVTIEPKQREQ